MNTNQNLSSARVEANRPSPANETGEDLTDGYWNENTLVSISDFRDIGSGVRRNYFERCDLENPEAQYFCAVNGECFGLIHRGNGSCIAEVETALGYACKGYRYVIFALKSRSKGAIKRWRDTWSKRTAPDAKVSMFDASVRGLAVNANQASTDARENKKQTNP